MLRIRYANGTVMQGILLALGDQKIRVALKGSDDVAEYRLINQRWVSEGRPPAAPRPLSSLR